VTGFSDDRNFFSPSRSGGQPSESWQALAWQTFCWNARQPASWRRLPTSLERRPAGTWLKNLLALALQLPLVTLRGLGGCLPGAFRPAAGQTGVALGIGGGDQASTSQPMRRLGTRRNPHDEAAWTAITALAVLLVSCRSCPPRPVAGLTLISLAVWWWLADFKQTTPAAALLPFRLRISPAELGFAAGL